MRMDNAWYDGIDHRFITGDILLITDFLSSGSYGNYYFFFNFENFQN
jgi:hypothetical protein